MIPVPTFDPDNVTTGGAGGATVTVTTLNPTGAGSLIDALNLTTPRTIKFSVTGDIDFATIKHTIQGKSNFTLDFSDAPGNGVQIVNGTLAFAGCGYFIVQYCRVRAYGTEAPPDGHEGITVTRGSHHFILRNCETEYTTDDGIVVFIEAGYPDIHDFVIENCLGAFALTLGSSIGMSISGSNGANVGSIRRFSVRNNIFANVVGRAPKVHGFEAVQPNYTEDFEVVNNIAYNITGERPEVSDKVRNARHEGNLMIHGPSENNRTFDFTQRLGNGQSAAAALSTIWQGNDWGRNHDQAGGTRSAIIGGYDGPGQTPYVYLADRPHNWTPAITDPDDLYAALVTGRACGAILPAIDELTELVYATIEDDTGDVIETAAETGINLGGPFPGVPDLTP